MSVLLRGVLEKRSREGEWKPQTFEVRSDHKLSYYAGGGLSRTLDFADVLKIERKNTNTLILWMDGSSRHQLRRPEDAPATGPSLDDFERECRRAHGAATAAARAPGKPRPPRTPAAVKAATPMSRGRRTVTFRSPTADDAPATPEAPATREDVASLRESAQKGFERLLSRSASPRVDADAVGSVAAARTRRVATCVDSKPSTRLQCELIRRFRREAFCRASRTPREQSIRPKISRIDFDLTEIESSEVWWGPPKPVVGIHTGRHGEARAAGLEGPRRGAEARVARGAARAREGARRGAGRAGDDPVAARVEINHWFGGSPPNFRSLYLDHIEVDSADFWTNRSLSSSFRSTAEEYDAIRSMTRTLKSG